MKCPACNLMNEVDALFCVGCGKSFVGRPGSRTGGSRRQYLIALLFVPVIVLAVAVGYYKFILPEGVAAIVNGEKITLSELDAAVRRMGGSGEDTPADLRYQALNELISERLVLQEAGKTGFFISKEEVAAAVRRARAESGLDEAAFATDRAALYGSERDFEKALERKLAVDRFIAQRVVPRGADQLAARRAVSRWLDDLSSRASVRIALTENLPRRGHGCCGRAESSSSAGSGQECRAGKQQPCH